MKKFLLLLCIAMLLCGCEKSDSKPAVFRKSYSTLPYTSELYGYVFTIVDTYSFDDRSADGKIGYVSFWSKQNECFSCRSPWPYKQNGTSIIVDCGDSIQHLLYCGDSIIHNNITYYLNTY